METPTVNFAEQISLYKQSGDIALRNEIVLNNMGLVRVCALSMRNMYIKFCEPDDVINEGVLALMDAIESYDQSKGAKFEPKGSWRDNRLHQKTGLDPEECKKILQNA